MKKIIIILFLILLLLVVSVVYFAPQYVKEYINKESEKITGAKIMMEDLSINPLIGEITVKGFKFGLDEKNIILETERFHINLGLWDIIMGKITVDRIQLVQPIINLQKFRNVYNYELVIKWYESLMHTTPHAKTTSSNLKYSIGKFEVINGILNFDNLDVPKHSTIPLNFASSSIEWDDATIKFLLEIKDKKWSSIKSDVNYNFNEDIFTALISSDGFNLQTYSHSLASLLEITKLKGKLSSDLSVKGSLNNPKNTLIKGNFSVEDIMIEDTTKSPLFSLNSLDVEIEQINFMKKIFNINNIAINDLYIRYDLYTSSDNLSSILLTKNVDSLLDKNSQDHKKKSEIRFIVNYIRKAMEGMTVTAYDVRKLSIEDVEFNFNDYSLHTPFHLSIHDLSLLSARIHSQLDTINLNLSAEVNGNGELLSNFKYIFPSTVLASFEIKDVDLENLSPYLEYYFKYPIKDGTMYFHTNFSILDKYLTSNIQIIVSDIEIGKKIKKQKEGYNVPLKLALKLLKNKNDDIKLNFPIEGDISNPKFKMRKVIMEAIKDVFIKSSSENDSIKTLEQF